MFTIFLNGLSIQCYLYYIYGFLPYSLYSFLSLLSTSRFQFKSKTDGLKEGSENVSVKSHIADILGFVNHTVFFFFKTTQLCYSSANATIDGMLTNW